MKIVMFITGEPQGKDRPRMAPGQFKPYTPKKTKDAEAAIVEAWRLSGEVCIPEEIDYWQGAEVTRVRVPIRATVTMLVKRGPSHYLTSGELNTKALRHPQPEDQKPDIDNAVKLVMDALNKCAYKDDVKIVTMEVRRRWSKSRVGTHIVIEPETEIGDWE